VGTTGRTHFIAGALGDHLTLELREIEQHGSVTPWPIRRTMRQRMTAPLRCLPENRSRTRRLAPFSARVLEATEPDELDGRALNVNEARPKGERGNSGGH